jgi:ureidoglycolate hydrolase
MKTVAIRTLTREGFAPYGTLIEHDPARPEAFQVAVEETRPTAWRQAINKITARRVNKLSRHPNTKESFAPLAGTVVMLVARPDTPQDFEAFLLDKPVCLDPNVWHASFCLSDTALVTICENLEVANEDHLLGFEVAGAATSV